MASTELTESQQRVHESTKTLLDLLIDLDKKHLETSVLQGIGVLNKIKDIVLELNYRLEDCEKKHEDAREAKEQLITMREELKRVGDKVDQCYNSWNAEHNAIKSLRKRVTDLEQEQLRQACKRKGIKLSLPRIFRRR